jgi:putative hemolysin
MNRDAFDEFSYAAPSDAPLKRFVIRLIERMTGQPRLRRLYRQYQQDHYREDGGTVNFWDEALRRLRLKLVFDKAALAQWPTTGPLVIVCNHPFGVIDGVAICAVTAGIRSDFRILTNAVLTKAEEIRGHLLPVDFAETREAQGTNLQSRKLARAHLAAGGCLIVFPAGGVSTTPSLWHRRAVDAEWKNLTARLILGAKAPVAPLYFMGQNSRMFQIASHLHQTLRLSLLFKEVHDRMGSEIHMRPGPVVAFEEVAHMSPAVLTSELRTRTYGLASDGTQG